MNTLNTCFIHTYWSMQWGQLREQTMTLSVADNQLQPLSYGLLFPGLKMNGGGGGINTRAPSTRFTENLTSDLETLSQVRVVVNTLWDEFLFRRPSFSNDHIHKPACSGPVKTYLYVTLTSGLNGYIYNNWWLFFLLYHCNRTYLFQRFCNILQIKSEIIENILLIK